MRGKAKGALALTRTAAPFVFLGLVTGAALPVEAQAQEQVRLRGENVAVFNLAGRVDVVAGEGDDVVVRITRGGDDASRLDLQTRKIDGRETLVVRYPDDRIVYPEMGRGSRTSVRVDDDGTFYGGDRGRRVRITGSGGGLEAWADLRISVPRDTDLAVYLAVGRTDVRDVVGDLLVDTGSGDVESRGTRGDLEIDTGSGSVVVRDAQGDLFVDTGSGEVELADVRGEDIEVDTGSGAVRGSGISASRLEVDTGSGEIVLSAVSCPDIELDTGSGEVELELLEDVDDLVVDTGSGEVILRVPASLGAAMEIDTGSGSIEVDLPLEIHEMEKDHVEGILGDGRGEIRIDTGSGGVRVTGN